MKTKLLIYLFLVIVIILSCDKKDVTPLKDDIIFTEINKSVAYLEKDSISGYCKDLIFEIINNGQTGYSAILKQNEELTLCDGFNSILLDSQTGQVAVLNENKLISKEGHWGSVGDLNLDNFAGKGAKYIGYRPGFYPSGITYYRYGWIKVELTSNRDTLKVICRATNNTNDKSIKAGQSK
jgi:hypothetical protein